jgi:hypothetical protein
MSMDWKTVLTPAAALASVVLSSGCAAPRVGQENAADFAAHSTEVVLRSPRAAGAVARCFETEARLLPLSVVRYEPDLNQTIYRLQGYGLWLEQASFRDLAAGGSEVRFRHAANYDARWLENVEEDRLAPLRHCAQVPT